MGLIRLFTNPLDPQSLETFSVFPGTTVIDWLQARYPSGAGGVVKVYIGLDELDPDDWDHPIADCEQATILVMPADPASLGITLVQALVTAAISAAVGLVIGLLFPPSRPKGFDGGDESPVYSISATTNRARVNEPVAVHYGTVSWAPDYAAAPYIHYTDTSNDQFVDELLCIGAGICDVDPADVYVGETPVSTLEGGAFQYWLFHPEDHGEKFGAIEAAVWETVKDGPNPIPFVENMFTSPEVENWEFNKDENEVPATPVAISGVAYTNPGFGGWGGSIVGVDSSLDIRPGQKITLAGTTNNNITFTVASIVIHPDDPLLMTIYETEPFQIQDEDPLSGTFTTDLVMDNMKAGPYRAQKIGQQIDSIDCDIVFPQGLMLVEGDGDQRYKDVTMQFTYQQIDEETGDPIGGAIVTSKTYRYKTRRPVRDTVNSGPLTPGSYEVTVERLSDFAGRGLSPEQTLWAGLKGHVVLDTSARAYGPVTLMAVRMKATNGLGQASRSRIRVTTTRDLHLRDSSNPISALKDVYENTDYGLGRDDAELNLAELDALELEWADGPKFNGSFDQRGTGFEAMSSIAAVAAAKVIHHNALVTVIPDRVQAVRQAMFNTGNTLRDTLEIVYTFDTEGQYDGVKVEYRDPFTFDPQFATWPTDAINPESMVLFGGTDQVYAVQYARYMWQVRSIRRKTVRLQTELDGLIPRFGDRIGVSHPMPDWGQSGTFTEQIDALTYRVDQALDWQETDNFIMLRDDQGVPQDPVAVTQGIHLNEVVFGAPPPVTIHVPGSREPSIYSFGRTTELVKDFIISSVTPQQDNIVEIAGQLYDESIYTGGPPHMGG